MALSFSGSGCLAAYQFGAARCLVRNGGPLMRTVTHVLGCSGGSLVAAVLCNTYSKATAIVLIGGVAVTVAGNELWTQTYGSSRTKFDGATDGALGIGFTSGLSPHSGWLYYLPSAVGLMVVVVLFAKVTTASTVWQWSTRQVGMPSAAMSVSTQAVRRSPRGAPVSPVLL